MNTEEEKKKCLSPSLRRPHYQRPVAVVFKLPAGPVRWRRRVVCLSLRRPAGGRRRRTPPDWSTAAPDPFCPAMSCRNPPRTFLLLLLSLTASACAGICTPPRPWAGLVTLRRTLRTALPRRTRPPHRPNTASLWTV